MAITPTRPSDETSKAITDMMTVIQDLTAYNSVSQLAIVNVTQQLFINYYDSMKAYCDDETENKSIIQHLTDDGLEQYTFMKQMYNMYRVYIF